MKIANRLNLVLALTAALTLASTSLQADKRPEQFQKDQTGTNPVNFSRDFRIYNEFTELNTEGDVDYAIVDLEGAG